jgi:cell division control protein 6
MGSGSHSSEEPAQGDDEGAPEPPARSPPLDPIDELLAHRSPLYKGSLEPLQEYYVPSRLLHREAEIARVSKVLTPALQGDVPSHLLVYGKIGTGKTAVVTQVQKEITRRASPDRPVTFLTVNCANVDTKYALLQTLGNQLVETLPGQEPIPTGWSHDRVYRSLCALADERGGIILFVLDEIDKLVQNAGGDVVYSLAQMNRDLKKARSAIVGISNDLKFTDGLDARVRSRLSQESIIFPPYNQGQLRDILRERAREVFEDDALDPDVLDRCAFYASQESGDARRALALLRLAAQITDRAHGRQVRAEHVVQAKNTLELDIIVECVKTLSAHCKLLLWVTISGYERRRSGITMGEAYKSYESVCHQLGVTPLVARTLAEYVSELETLGLVHAEIYSGGRRGRTRLITSAVPSHETLRALEEDPLLKPLSQQRTSGQTSLFRFDGQDPSPPRGLGASRHPPAGETA